MTSVRSRVPARWLAALFLLLLVFLVGSGTARAQDGGGKGGSDPTAADSSLKFGIGPARQLPQDQVVDGRPYLKYAATPGATISDKVALLNYGSAPLTLQLYATDALQASDGGFALLPGGQPPSDAGSWFKLAVPKDGMVTVPPRDPAGPGLRYVPLAISVPADATPGDHVGGVVASLQVTSTNSQGAKVTLDQRVGLRAYFQLSGDLKPELKIEDLKATYQDQHDPLGRGPVTVSYVVHNTGNIRLDASQDISVSRWVAGSFRGVPPDIKDILPGSRISVTQTFDRKFGLGRLAATVTLHPRAVDPAYFQQIPDVTSSKTFWAWPWVLIAIIAGFLILLLVIDLRRRRKKRLKFAASSSPATAGSRERVAAPTNSARSLRGRLRPSNLAVFAVVAGLVALGPIAIGTPRAQAEPPKGSLGEVIFETGDSTGVPSNAVLDGWWGHEGAKTGKGTGTTFVSMNAGDKTGAVTDASVAALHEKLGDGGSFDQLRIAFVPYSADGSNERPQVTKGESVADAYKWFADLGMGAALSGNTNPNDAVATVSTGPEFKAWWDAGRPLQGYTDDLKVIDIADDSTTRPATTPQGASILDRWPAGTKVSMVLYLSDGTDKDRPGLSTVAVGPDGRAMASWLTFKTVADPDDPTRSSAGYEVLTGKGTGSDAPVPSGDPIQTGGADPTSSSDGASGSGSPSATASGGTASDGSSPADPGAALPSETPGANTTVGDGGTSNAVVSSLPGGTPTFVLLLVALVLAVAGWATWWLRSGRSTAAGKRL